MRLKPPSFNSFVKSDIRLIGCFLFATDFNTLSTQTFRRKVSMTSDVKAALLSSEEVFSPLMAQQGDDLAPRNVNQHHVLLRCINYTAGPPQESLIAQADILEVTPLFSSLGPGGHSFLTSTTGEGMIRNIRSFFKKSKHP